MISLIEQSKPALAALCRRFKVSRLFVFGSGANGRFDPDASDLDFVVELADRQPNKSYADRYLGLAEALERLFGRRVDLLTEQSIRNPYLRREVQATRELVYEQRGEETPVNISVFLFSEDCRREPRYGKNPTNNQG
jgi:predicted nucleotidyltransferase